MQVTTIYLHLLRLCNLKNNASYEVKTKRFLFESRISAETYAIYKVTRNSRSKLMHRVMNGSFYCTLARNFCRQSPSCTNPSQFQIHFSKTFSKPVVKRVKPLSISLVKKGLQRTQHSLQQGYSGPGRKHCFHFIPCSLLKVSLKQKN